VGAITHAVEGAAEHAAAWHFTHLVTASGEPPRYRVRRLGDHDGGDPHTPGPAGHDGEAEHGDPGDLARAIAGPHS
jgi:hypothetical protein